MGGIGDRLCLKLTIDTYELEQVIVRMKSAMDLRTKCVMRDCPKQGLERNLIMTTLDKDESYPVFLYTCDEHYPVLSYLNAPLPVTVLESLE